MPNGATETIWLRRISSSPGSACSRFPGEYTYLLYYIQGREVEHQDAYEKDFKHADPATVKVEEINPKTLRVTLKQYVACFPEICAMPGVLPAQQGVDGKVPRPDRPQGDRRETSLL